MKRLLLLGIPALLVACADGTTPTQPASQAASYSAQPSFAVASDQFSAKNKNWRVYNVEPATNSFWDINKAQSDGNGGLQFPFQQFVSPTEGSFAVYLLNNYNVDMTGNTITSTMSWTSGTYQTRSTSTDCSGAYVRLEFQDVASGPYDSNDYWWSTFNLDLNSSTHGSSLTASLAERTLWTNQSGKRADDATPNWVEWQGDIVAMSPYEGFTKAVKNVKQVGLSFGNSCSYASGVAVVGTDADAASFHMTSFTVTP
jgi:hypothetical protein